jgi:hypothetical protein
MTVSQSTFRNAVLDPKIGVPKGLVKTNDQSAGSRFDVYRNNVVHSLTEALRVAFPLVSKLIGPANFGRLAGEFVRQHPPASPLMMYYGEALPAYLEDFEPLAHLGYLPDCARLDLALRASYHAGDTAAMDTTVFADPDALMRECFSLAPPTRILKSVWPLHDLWAYNTIPGAAKPTPVAQDVLITRPEFDPSPHVLPKGGADWLLSLEKGRTFGEAVEEIQAQTPDFDLSAALTLVLREQALTKPTTKDI